MTAFINTRPIPVQRFCVLDEADRQGRYPLRGDSARSRMHRVLHTFRIVPAQLHRPPVLPYLERLRRLSGRLAFDPVRLRSAAWLPASPLDPHRL